jgi:hypothetical protein
MNKNFFDLRINFYRKNKNYINLNLIKLLKNNFNYPKLIISNIDCGSNFSLIFNESIFYYLFLLFIEKKIKKESLFLFGNNEFKQLGIEEVDLIPTITNDIIKNFKIETKKIKKFKCGGENMLILIEG